MPLTAPVAAISEAHRTDLLEADSRCETMAKAPALRGNYEPENFALVLVTTNSMVIQN